MIHFVRIGRRRWLYFGTEDEVSSSKVWEPFWFREENPPYRIGNGWRMREDHDVAFHVGIARTYPGVSNDLEILDGTVLEIPPHELGLWGAEAASSDAGEDPPAARTSLFSRAEHLDRVEPDAGWEHAEIGRPRH